MKNPKISIIGIGYVGLPLALEFGKYFHTVAFDLSKKKIDKLKKSIDETKENPRKAFKAAKFLKFTHNKNELINSNLFIIAVPTPIYNSKKPDLRMIISASKTVGKCLKENDIVVYESTVYPGMTEEVCIPILERESSLLWKKDFNVGYSPERINPGDKKRKITDIKKVVSADTERVLNFLAKVYGRIIRAGIYKSESIKTAEAAKIIENTQRDLNIALINELAILFDRLNISTQEVLKTANTKWNFLDFKPGLVGGHCIGIDPYYLTYKSKKIGYNPKVILSGRNTNDNMAKFISHRVKKSFKNNKKTKRGIIFGFSFKENCSDFRNTKINDLKLNLEKDSFNIDIFDPLVDVNDVYTKYSFKVLKKMNNKNYDFAIMAVKHDIFSYIDVKLLKKKFGNKIKIFDLKYFFKKEEVFFQL